jgi:CheY-like chemotaxis protein
LNLSRFSLHEFLKSCKEAYDERANDRGLELSIETGAGQTELMIESDRDRWNKIITHLLDNALKYTLKGSVRLGYSAHKEHFEVYVADTGIGIDEKYADSIFQNFSRGALGDTQHSGLGIGLAIVKEHVRALGGSISLDTNSEKGSTFRISIPLGNAGEVDDRSTDSTEQISALRVLIADGESDSSLIGRLAMNSSREWQSVYVADGKEAVEYCRTSSPIDLVVLSDDLPVMNGMEAAQRIKLYRPDLPLIALETKKGELNKEQAFECGFQAVLSEDSGMNEALRVIGALEAK